MTAQLDTQKTCDDSHHFVTIHANKARCRDCGKQILKRPLWVDEQTGLEVGGLE